MTGIIELVCNEYGVHFTT